MQTFEPTLWIAQSTSERFLTPTFGHSLAGCKNADRGCAKSTTSAPYDGLLPCFSKKLSLCFASECEQIRLESS
jgi:hypothetical protein